MGRGLRCLCGVWVTCVADTSTVVDRLQEQQGERDVVSCLTLSQTLEYSIENIIPLRIS